MKKFKLLLLFNLILAACATKFPAADEPALESILTSFNGAKQIVAQNTDGNYSVFPASFIQFKVRAPSYTDFELFMDRQEIKQVKDNLAARNHPQFSQGGLFWIDTNVLLDESFYVLNVIPPIALQGGRIGQTIDVEIINLTRSKSVPPGLRVAGLIFKTNTSLPGLPFVTPVSTIVEPNTIFSSGENSKDYQNPLGPLDRHSEWSIVSRKVSLAGWLKPGNPSRNDGNSGGITAGQSEDWHYVILLDNDYIERNYSTPVAVQPLATAVLPGNPSFDSWPYNLPHNDINFINNQSINAGLFLLPNQSEFWGELNAYHLSARGPRPAGWFSDPDQQYFDNAWPFRPLSPSVGPRGFWNDLKEGDYVVISGTLWQDSGHTVGSSSSTNPTPFCWDSHFRGQGGWLEIHPIDMVRKIRPPMLQKTPHVVSVCTLLNEPAADKVFFLEPNEPKKPGQNLKFAIQDDNRFIKQTTINIREETIENDRLKVHLNVGNPLSGGCFKAVYLVWWE